MKVAEVLDIEFLSISGELIVSAMNSVGLLLSLVQFVFEVIYLVL